METQILLVIIAGVLLFSSNINAQTPQALSSSDILLGLKKLNVLGSILYVGAHPDDENNPLLPYLANDLPALESGCWNKPSTLMPASCMS